MRTTDAVPPIGRRKIAFAGGTPEAADASIEKIQNHRR
jgi:hypothetical protein